MGNIDGFLFAKMITFGTVNLKSHAKEINDLNVFPIPDGDTGDNMLLTMMGGSYTDCDSASLGTVAEHISSKMLMAARGNSGVILSQFFEGIKNGFIGLDAADVKELGNAFRLGVDQAYGSVMNPVEGTILTVMREATEYACMQNAATAAGFLEAFVAEAKKSLMKTPELLPVLKKAGVVDSGAAGLISIVEGMKKALLGDELEEDPEAADLSKEIDIDAFTADSVLEFGYCTEVLVRLQNVKTDIAAFDIKSFTDHLQSMGDSVAAVQNESILKLHIHTLTPHKVLEFCQKYGEFLKVKIENMSLQHNSTVIKEKQDELSDKRKKYGVVSVATGEGLKKAFMDRGADVTVEGGQSMNPSAEEFISAFDKVNADTVFVLPNNGNVVLTAEQAAKLYKRSDVRVIKSTSIGAGYAALSMMDTSSDDADSIVEDMSNAMDGVVTAELSRSIRNVVIDGKEIQKDDYIGFVGKNIYSINKSRILAACELVDKLDINRFEICILIGGKASTADESKRIEQYITSHFPGKEVYTIDGMQEVYDYILILE